MTGLLLTHRFSSQEPADDAEIWAFAFERWTREMRYRDALGTSGGIPESQTTEAISAPSSIIESTLAQMVPARDAGDVCGVCGELVTWVDHLPPLDAKSAVRCMKNVHHLNPLGATGVVIDDIFPRVDTTDEEEAAFRESFGYAVNDPKHPDYHSTYADASDMREDF